MTIADRGGELPVEASPFGFTIAFRAEHELVLRCARTQLTAEDEQRLRKLLQTDLKWEEVLRVSFYHGIAQLLFRHLHRMGGDAVPPDVLERLRRANSATAANSLRLTGELLRVLRLFEAHDIPAIPLKGPVLAVYAYGDVTLRPFGDLDILVHTRDLSRARALLEQDGYRFATELSAAQEQTLLQDYHHLALQSDARNVLVELHWKLAQDFTFALDPEEVWARVEHVSLGRDTVPTLAREDLLLYLCAHGAKHAWESLEWVVGVAELLRHHHVAMDWKSVLQRAEALAVARRLRLGLALAQGLLQAPLPEWVAQWAHADRQVAGRAKWLAEQLLQASPESGAAPGLRSFLFQLWNRDRLRDRVHYLKLFTVPTRHEWTLTQLPDALFPLYSVIRPARLMVKHGRRVAARLLSRP